MRASRSLPSAWLVAVSCGALAGFAPACSGGDAPQKASQASALPTKSAAKSAPQAPAKPAEAAAGAAAHSTTAQAPVAAPSAEKLTPEAIDAIFADIPTQDQCDLEIGPLIEPASADVWLQRLEQEFAQTGKDDKGAKDEKGAKAAGEPSKDAKK